jgi:predicted TIM-barrel fold metal-dependent hydrolase
MKFALPDHILFGTDYPFELSNRPLMRPGLGMSADGGIDRENAEKLLPRFM